MVGPATCARLNLFFGATKARRRHRSVSVFLRGITGGTTPFFSGPPSCLQGYERVSGGELAESSAQLLAAHESRLVGGERRRGEAALFHAASSGGGLPLLSRCRLLRPRPTRPARLPGRELRGLREAPFQSCGRALCLCYSLHALPY